ncbi:MAG: hypothetical protein JXQ72_01255 [Anaerolineae bacterium]|nr:hypothetical protein [Anaerolineae bacterium]
MAMWHGYVLIEKPPALTGQEWRDVLVRLRAVLNHLPDSRQPAHRLHTRLRPDGGAVILEAAFEARDLDIEDLARLPTYIAAVVPRFTVEQVRDAMRQYITIQGGTTDAAWRASQAAARQYVRNHADVWELES